MADDAREYLRAAQQAEVRGDKARAVELLEKVAKLYTAAGNPTRALSALRHAKRLDDGRRPELELEVKRLEWLPEDPLARAMAEPLEEKSEEEEALAPLDAFQAEAQAREKELIERGPQLADPSLAAWCSFCCRPRTEVGELVAGPAGAFVCAACTEEAGRLLAGAPGAKPAANGVKLREVARSAGAADEANAALDDAKTAAASAIGGADAYKSVAGGGSPAGDAKRADSSVSDSAAADDARRADSSRSSGSAADGARRTPGAVSRAGLAVDAPGATTSTPDGEAPLATHDLSGVELVGQQAAVALLDRAMRSGARGVALFGPMGSGKTTYLKELARRGLGRYVLLPELDASRHFQDDQRLLIDGLEQASPAARERAAQVLASPKAPPFLLAVRARPVAGGLVVRGEEGELTVHPTRSLVEATDGALPEALALRLQVVAQLAAPAVAELQEVARRLLLHRAAELDLSEELLAALAQEAAKAPSCGHELAALLLRLPPGSWTAKPVEQAEAVASGAPKRKRSPRTKKGESGVK